MLTLSRMCTLISYMFLRGTRWSEIAMHLVGRTDNDVKNVWSTQIKRHSNTYYKVSGRGRKSEAIEEVVMASTIPESSLCKHNNVITTKIDETTNISGVGNFSPMLLTNKHTMSPRKSPLMGDYMLQDAILMLPPLMPSLSSSVNEVDSCTSSTEPMTSYDQSSSNKSMTDVDLIFMNSYNSYSPCESLVDRHSLVPDLSPQYTNSWYTCETLDLASTSHFVPECWTFDSLVADL